MAARKGFKRLLTRQQEPIFRLLIRTAPVSVDRIAWVLWSDAINGPPKTATNTIRVQIHYMRQSLAPYGVRIRTCPGDGYVIESDDRGRARALLNHMPMVTARRQPVCRAA